MLTTARVNDFVFGQGQNGRDIYSQWFSECIVYLYENLYSVYN